MQQLNEMKRLLALFEYIVKGGSPIAGVLALNLFQDFDDAEGCSAHYEEFRNSASWQKIVSKYKPKVDALRAQIVAQQGRLLTSDEGEVLDRTWYDGSDAYDSDPDFEWLVQCYDQQLEAIEALLADEITSSAWPDDDEPEE